MKLKSTPQAFNSAASTKPICFAKCRARAGCLSPILFLASRFAAKEALSKAMGTGLRHPVNLTYITVAHDRLGKPFFEFHPELTQLINDQGIRQHHLSISDEINMACAFVILEK